MSTTSGPRGPTTRSRAASSRAASEAPSVADDAHSDLRSSRAGSPKTKRFDVSTRESKTYGSKPSRASAQRKTAARMAQTVGNIQHAVDQAQAQTGESSLQGQGPALARVEEEINIPQAANEAIAATERYEHEQQYQHDDDIQLAREFNGNQPLEGTSVLQKQMTLSDSETSIARTRPATYFLPKLFMAITVLFLLILTFSVADIYRGPFFGPRFDLLKSRHVIGNQSAITPCDVSNIEHRLSVLEHQLHNLPDQLHTEDKQWRINFFSKFHRVSVDPYLTSPTGTEAGLCKPKSRLWEIIHLLWKPDDSILCPIEAMKNGPATVFGPWDEDSGPAWCAAAGEAKLQIGAIVQAPMTPTEVVVEHNPWTNELEPRSVPAPKEIELWMEVLEDGLRETIGRAAEATYGNFETNPVTKAYRSLPSKYVPIGRWTYDYPSGKSTQVLKVSVDLAGAQTTKLAVRVNSNWAGEQYTCLYRLRLYGISHHPSSE
ncbi:MAG: hypothetical protein Q9201_003805 [Fulgogasparrea decipioides]